MAINESLTERVRKALPARSGITEKKMFRGIAFMRKGLLLMSAGDDEFLFRVSIEEFEKHSADLGCRPMMRGGKIMRGYIYVQESSLRGEAALKKWIDRAIGNNNRLASGKAI